MDYEVSKAKFDANVEALSQVPTELIKREKEIVKHNGRRSDTTFKKVHPVPDIGDVFGELTVTGYVLKPTGTLKDIIVKCSCGAPEYTANEHNLRKGRTRRCIICSNKARNTKRKKHFGFADILPDDNHRARLLARIYAAIYRCTKPNDKNYQNYGGRGITVHPEWIKDRRGFLAHLITLDGWDKPELDMDRIDTDKGYEPGNLRFITRSENMYNKRKMHVVQENYDAHKMLLEEACERLEQLEAENEMLRNLLNNREYE